MAQARWGTHLMNELHFHRLVDALMRRLEDKLDTLIDKPMDLDYENNSRILTITFSDKSKVILSRQPALQQIWLASRSDGYHFAYKDETWTDIRGNQTLLEILSQICSQKLGEAISM